MKLRNKKTGEIIETDYKFGVSIPTDRFMGCKSYDQIAEYNSLAELNEEWEDAPAEPLIKDEKIRKAVRAWAEALGAGEVRYNSCAEYSEGRFEAEMGMVDIDFGRVLDLKDDNYTIAELCGEEKE